MTEEEYFRKNYPDSCYGDKPLSPHWDFFQDGVEFGERQSENKIAELKKACDETQELLDKQIEAAFKLDKENEGLRLKLEALEGQTPWKDIKDKSELIKENAELKDDNKVMADNYSKMEQKFYNNLTKVKELIKKIEKVFYNGEEALKRLPKIYDILVEAEQLLNEVENDSKSSL